MPTYEYVCTKCDHQFEVFQSMTDPPLSICPKDLCPKKKWGRGKIKRAIGTGAGLIFKGSGFYITDYRSESYREAAKKESAPSTAGDAKPKPSADTKAKTESTGGGAKPPASAPAATKS
jgi:putative FmdB family regulatory protein